MVNWAKALSVLPPPERPDIILLTVDDAGRAATTALRNIAADVRGFEEADRLDLDLVYPVTHVFEAPLGAPWAAWIPDWQHRHLPEMFDAVEHARRQVHYSVLATRAPLVVLSSGMAERDMLQAHGHGAAPHVVLPFPAVIDPHPDPPSVCARHGVRGRFLIVCNQWWRHKNHDVVLRALTHVRDEGVVCVFTGDTSDPRWPDHYPSLLRYIRAQGLEDTVRILGAIPRDEQLALMQAAMAVVQPSRFEGWSTVLEEARALGTPVIASSFPVHLEQAPPRAQFFAPDDDLTLAGLIRTAWRTSASAIPDGDEQRARILACARGLLRVAERTRSEYSVTRHDPPRLAAELLAELAGQRQDPAISTVYTRALAAAEALCRQRADWARAFHTAARGQHSRKPSTVVATSAARGRTRLWRRIRSLFGLA